MRRRHQPVAQPEVLQLIGLEQRIGGGHRHRSTSKDDDIAQGLAPHHRPDRLVDPLQGVAAGGPGGRGESPALTSSRPAWGVWVAPTSMGACSLASDRSIATMGWAPAIAAPCPKLRPTPPVPITATLEPGPTFAVLVTA